MTHDPDPLLDHLAQVADTQSLATAIGVEMTPARERLSQILKEHGCASPCRLKTALDLYDAALRRCAPFLPVPLPSAVQESIDLAQQAYLESTGQEPLSLLQLAPAAHASNPFRAMADG